MLVIKKDKFWNEVIAIRACWPDSVSEISPEKVNIRLKVHILHWAFSASFSRLEHNET